MGLAAAGGAAVDADAPGAPTGTLQLLVDLSNKPDEQIRRGCAAALCNLAAGDGAEPAVLEAGAVPALLIIALVSSDRAETKELCAKALFNLLNDAASHEQMVGDGVIWGLAALSKPPDDDAPGGSADGSASAASGGAASGGGASGGARDRTAMQDMCATAFCNLSHSYSAQLVGSTSTLNAIFALLDAESGRVRVVAARAVLNLLTKHGAANSAGGALDLKVLEQAVVRTKGLLVRALARRAPRLRRRRERGGARDLRARAVPALAVLPARADRPQGAGAARRAADVPDARHEVRARARALEHGAVRRDLARAHPRVHGPDGEPARVRRRVRVERDRRRRRHHEPHADRARGRAHGLLPLVQGRRARAIVAHGGMAALQVLSPWTPEADPMLADADGAAAAPGADAAAAPSADSLAEKEQALLARLSVATLHNVSVCPDAQNAMVNAGAVDMVVAVWPLLDDDMRALAALVVCNLCCGNINTARVVDARGTPCCASRRRSRAASLSHAGAIGARRRCSAALRNLLCVSANQRKMASDGVIDTLVELAGLEDETTRQNCACALRILTYNTSTRELLVSSGAIDVILADSESSLSGSDGAAGAAGGGAGAGGGAAGGLAVSHALLCKIETESWANGSRGSNSEGRAPHVPPPPLYLNASLLQADDSLEISLRATEWYKVRVEIAVQEPELEQPQAVSDGSEGDVDAGAAGARARGSRSTSTAARASSSTRSARTTSSRPRPTSARSPRSPRPRPPTTARTTTRRRRPQRRRATSRRTARAQGSRDAGSVDLPPVAAAAADGGQALAASSSAPALGAGAAGERLPKLDGGEKTRAARGTRRVNARNSRRLKEHRELPSGADAPRELLVGGRARRAPGVCVQTGNAYLALFNADAQQTGAAAAAARAAAPDGRASRDASAHARSRVRGTLCGDGASISATLARSAATSSTVLRGLLGQRRRRVGARLAVEHALDRARDDAHEPAARVPRELRDAHLRVAEVGREIVEVKVEVEGRGASPPSPPSPAASPSAAAAAAAATRACTSSMSPARSSRGKPLCVTTAMHSTSARAGSVLTNAIARARAPRRCPRPRARRTRAGTRRPRRARPCAASAAARRRSSRSSGARRSRRWPRTRPRNTRRVLRGQLGRRRALVAREPRPLLAQRLDRDEARAFRRGARGRDREGGGRAGAAPSEGPSEKNPPRAGALPRASSARRRSRSRSGARAAAGSRARARAPRAAAPRAAVRRGRGRLRDALVRERRVVDDVALRLALEHRFPRRVGVARMSRPPRPPPRPRLLEDVVPRLGVAHEVDDHRVRARGLRARARGRERGGRAAPGPERRHGCEGGGRRRCLFKGREETRWIFSRADVPREDPRGCTP